MYMSILWKINYDYKKQMKELKREKKCKEQFSHYLKYLESKDIKINNYISVGDSLIN